MLPTTKSLRKLYPEHLYDDLFQAGLVGEGIVKIMGHYTTRKEPRRGRDNVWRDTDILIHDSTRDSMTLVPVKDYNGRIIGDWTTGLSSEQVKRIHEEAGVPIFVVDQDNKSDSEIRVHHSMQLDLSDPVQNAKFKVIVHNNEIALRKEDLTEDQDYYFFSKAEENNKKKEQMHVKEAAVNLIRELSQEAKEEILELMTYESKLVIPESANIEDKLLLFQEQCWDNPKEIVRVYKIEDKSKRIVLYVLLQHNVIVSSNYDYTGPFYRPSATPHQEYGEGIGESVTEACANLGKPACADLYRKYLDIRKGVKEESFIDKIIDNSDDAMSKILKQVNEMPEYELPENITNTWIKNAPKVGLETYLNREGVRFEDGLINKQLRDLARAHKAKSDSK